MSVILILTHVRDDCADLVINHLVAASKNFVRFNTDEFQSKIKFSALLDSNGRFSGRYVFPDRILDFGDISAVWNRRIHRPKVTETVQGDPEINKWIVEESEWALNNSFTLIDAPMVNPWEVNERLKHNKWIQMRRAAELGFEVPESCMTNEQAAIGEFWNQTGHEMIFKKIRKGLFHLEDGRTLLVHTSKVPEEKMTADAVRRMRFCPMFLQRHIPKHYDVRSVVVHDRVFSVAIHSQNVDEGVVDFRTAAVLGKIDKMKHERIELGKETDDRLIRFTKSFGLAFGAFDLVVTPDDRIVFLEDNPNGQWAWLEHRTGAPISKAIADFLIALSTGEIRWRKEVMDNEARRAAVLP